MSSQALARFQHQLSNAETLRKTNPTSQSKSRQIYYHASLAITVAAWDAFIKNITKEFNSRTILFATTAAFQSIHASLTKQLEDKTKRLNTPDYNNARNHILEFTGYDTIGIWHYSQGNLTSQQVKNRIEEIFKVRHSFAHGFPIPPLSWTISPRGGAPRLTAADLAFNEKIITHLTNVTDKNLDIHMRATFGMNF